MKRTLPLFLAVALLMPLLCTSVAQAAYAPSIGREDMEIDDPDVPLVEVPEIRVVVDPDDTGRAAVPEGELLDAVQKAADGEAIRITVVSRDGNALSEVTLTKGSLQALKDSDAQIMLVTTDGRIALTGSALAGFDDEITFVIKREAALFGGEVGLKVCVDSKGVASYSWTGEALTLYVPVIDRSFAAGNSYCVKQLNENGKQVGTYVGQCVEEDGRLWVVVGVDSSYLGYFAAQPGAVSNTTAVADPTIVTSPLAAARHSAKPGLLASVERWFDSVANQIMALLGL